MNASTSLTPKESGYPFGNANVLEGWIYYVRLTQGSSNGLPMVPIESSSLSSMTGFYQASDNRERIDADSRYSATKGTALTDPNNAIDRVESRGYLAPGNNAITRFIVFTFPKGGTCVNCGPGLVGYQRFDENGNAVENTQVNLNRIVNVINVSGTQNGDVSLRNIPGGWETYAFSTNSASPGFNPALTWDAIFEAFVNVQLEQDVTPPPDPILEKTLLLKGKWHFVYTIISTFANDYILTTISNTTNNEGGYPIYGIDEFNEPVVANYWPPKAYWTLFDTGTLVDRFFVFYTDGNSILPNSCYYQFTKSTGEWSQCYALSGSKLYSLQSTGIANPGTEQVDKTVQAIREAAASAEVKSAPIDEGVAEKYRQMKLQ